jgi:hypothetical protein
MEEFCASALPGKKTVNGREQPCIDELESNLFKNFQVMILMHSNLVENA